MCSILFFCSDLYAQNKEYWNTLELSTKLDSNFNFMLASDYFSDYKEGLYQWNVGGYLTYDVNYIINSITVAYRYQPTILDDEDHEHRIIITPKNKYNFGIFQLAMRNRIEFRMHTSYRNNIRLRHRLKLKTRTFKFANYYISSEIFKNSYDSKYKKVRSLLGFSKKMYGVNLDLYLGYKFNIYSASRSELYIFGLALAKSL